MHHVQRRARVAGGAEFVGSHLCDRLLAEGMEVVALDNLQTRARANLAYCFGNSRFQLIKAADIVEPLPRGVAHARFDEIHDLACPAFPPSYHADPGTSAPCMSGRSARIPTSRGVTSTYTLITSAFGTRQLFRLAGSCKARVPLSSTSGFDSDPLKHAQSESDRGNVNPVGPRACYDEGKRVADDPQRRRPDVRTAFTIIGWQPSTSLRNGLQATIAWFADSSSRAPETAPVVAVA